MEPKHPLPVNRDILTRGKGTLTCALCGKQVRSLYSQRGDRKVKLCATCFFDEPPTTEAA